MDRIKGKYGIMIRHNNNRKYGINTSEKQQGSIMNHPIHRHQWEIYGHLQMNFHVEPLVRCHLGTRTLRIDQRDHENLTSEIPNDLDSTHTHVQDNLTHTHIYICRNNSKNLLQLSKTYIVGYIACIYIYIILSNIYIYVQDQFKHD